MAEAEPAAASLSCSAECSPRPAGIVARRCLSPPGRAFDAPPGVGGARVLREAERWQGAFLYPTFFVATRKVVSLAER